MEISGAWLSEGLCKIDRDVVITGNNDRAQIWSADNWKAKTQQQLNPETISALLEAGNLRYGTDAQASASE